MDFTKGEMLVITGLAAMVEEEGKTPHEAIQRARDIEKEVYFALCDLQKETKE
ncbi:hypothetical protein KM915_25915 [Cytobacillus oceanisediminis]|uniref:hypothetical protein n=1 Tax=Cytobacillus oceanisediminis TaxID=665099 RepID=UPI001C2427D1|nr:hypothetical protein [Cytobacillus oceanisediminis]MBU8733453.1 hypothetical protein [Cytobacillus oceanisediminis]